MNHLRAPRSGVDIVQMVSDLHERVDVSALRAAWEQVTARHDALRTAFRWNDVTEPQQDVHELAPPVLTELDWTDADAETVAERKRAFLADDRVRGFSLDAPPLQRVTLIRLAETEWIMVWTFHHILMDGRSFPIVLREMFSMYESALSGESAVLPERRPFRDFVEWYSAKDFSTAESFWRERLRGLAGATPLPAGFGDGTERGRGWHTRMFAAEPTAALERLARANGLTMNNVIQGAWALLLARHSGEDDVVFGATRACRKATIDGADDIVGMLINTLPVRVAVKSDMPLIAWLGELRETWRSLFDVEHTPLRLVQRWSDVSASMPMFETSIVFENLSLDATLKGTGGGMGTRDFELLGGTNFALTALVFGGKEMTLQIDNDRTVVDDATALRLLDHFAAILESMAVAEDVGDVSMLPARERELVVREWNDTVVAYPAEATLVSLMAEQAMRTPNATAVSDEHRSLTYTELDACANALAHELRAQGVGRGVLVGVCAERSVEMVVALVAIVKAGGAYVPLDPEYPAERLAFMLEDADAPVVLAQKEVVHVLPPHGAKVVLLDDVASVPSERVSPLEGPLPDDAAYMIFTSGSTGRPKGAMNSHRGIVNRLLWMQGQYKLGSTDVVLQKTPYSFDVSVWEFFWPLLSGATLVMARPGGHRDTSYLVDVVTSRAVTVCHFVPSMLRAFIADKASSRCTTLRDVMASGEALPPDLVAAFYGVLPNARLHNLYGPTECAVDVSYWACPPTTTPPAVVPIGRPVANTQLYVLDARGEPCPIGVPGELYLAGAQVGMGYYNRPELTAEKFVTDPFREVQILRLASLAQDAPRMYRTGDKARWRPDGTVEYLGRLDFQVKIRGYRIELGEIEAALALHAHVREAAVVARDDGKGENRLVAYVVADGEPPTLGALREHLMLTLPNFMVPATFMWLSALPLTSSGKVDRRALPEPELDRHTLSRAYVAPRTTDEKTLAEIWMRVLRVEQVGVEDNLFELGGDSLLSVQIVSQARIAGLGLTLTQVLRNPTVSALARVAQVASAREQLGEAVGPVPLTPIQHWFFEGQRDDANHWNQAFLFTIPADLDADTLAAALTAVTRHHDSLRLRFDRLPDGWHQRCVADAEASVVDEVYLWQHPVANHAALMLDTCEKTQRMLDITNGPLVRVALIHLAPEQPGRMLVAVHHLAIDGVSWRVLLEDLETAYAQIERGEAVVLPARTTPYSRWATSLSADAKVGSGHRTTTGVRSANDVSGTLAYWERIGSPESLRLPRDIPADGEDVAANTEIFVVSLDAVQTRALLQDVPAAYNTQINDALLAALAEALGAWAGAGEIVVNVEGHGREDVIEGADLARTMGWFTTIFPVRLRLGTANIGARLSETKELLRAVPSRGFGYGVLRYLDGAETLRAQTTPDIVFNYLGQFDQVLAQSSMFGFASEPTGAWYGPRSLRRHLLELNALVVDGRLELRWSFSVKAHRRETIAMLAEGYASALRGVIAHCTTPGAGGFTPSDFPLAQLDQASLDEVAAGRRDVEDIYPLVPMQRLFLGYADPASDPGFEQWRYRLHGPLDVSALHAAWDLVTARHAIFRTAFVSKGLKEPMQVVRRDVVLPWAEYDWRAFDAEEQNRKMRDLLADDRAKGFAFDRAPLMRITLVRLADDQYELVWSNHHLLLDRWSWPLVLLEISYAYPSFARGEQPAFPPATRYADFVAWQQEQSLGEAQEFWSRHFEGFVAPTRLTPSHVDADTSEVEEVAVELTAAETHAVQALARGRQVAVNTVVAGAWALWLAKRASHDDVSFGVTVAGRDGGVEGIERLVGLTINNLPLRVRATPAAALGPWLAELQHSQAEMQRFAHAPLERVQEWSGVPWRTRLFDTLLVFQHDGAEDLTGAWLGDSVETSLVHVPTHTAYPLSVMIAGGESIALRVTFDQRYFDAAAAREMAEGLRLALLAMVDAPQATIGVLLAALPEPSAARATSEPSHEYVAPKTATESVVASLWSDILGAERVGVTDNFFMLGGYSLVATQIVSRVRATLQLDVPVRVLFANPTVAAFAAALTKRERKPGELERIARVVQRVHAMSLDELRHAGAARNATT
ncbi:MAG: amino acid adenylation domain-containing protein [bacterium]